MGRHRATPPDGVPSVVPPDAPEGPAPGAEQPREVAVRPQVPLTAGSAALWGAFAVVMTAVVLLTRGTAPLATLLVTGLGAVGVAVLVGVIHLSATPRRSRDGSGGAPDA